MLTMQARDSDHGNTDPVDWCVCTWTALHQPWMTKDDGHDRYLQGRPEEAASLLNQSEEETRECFGEESERRLIVTYGDLAWLNYHTGDYTQSHTHCQRVEDILIHYETTQKSFDPLA
eukprot:superscaffoldBa00002316_g13888